jgi:eukaryotic-like serine/threonine-protein kinase
MNYNNKNILFILLLFLAGCSGINLNQKIIPTQDDWIMAGNDSKQQNISFSALDTPLNFLWSYNPDAGIGQQTISVSDAIVFFNTLQGEMYSLDLSSGSKIGQLNFLGKEGNTTPLIFYNKVILSYAADNKYSLTSYDMLNDQINWSNNLGDFQTSPVLYKDFIYLGSLNGKFYKINPVSGNVIWTFTAKSAIHSNCSVNNDNVVFGTDDGTIYCLNTNDGFQLWKFKTGLIVIASPMIFENSVYFGSCDSNYYSLNLTDGSLMWKKNISSKIITGSTLFQNKYAVFGSVDGYLYALSVADSSIVWKFLTKGTVSSTPISSGNNIFFSSLDMFLYCLDGNNGNLKWKYDLEWKSKTSPVVWGKYLLIASDHYVYCFTSNPVQ